MDRRLSRVTVLAGGIAACLVFPVWAVTDDPVAAIVNGHELHLSNVKATQARTQYSKMDLDKVYDKVIAYAVNGELLLQEANKQKLGDSPELKEQVQKAKDDLLMRVYLTKQVDAQLNEDDLHRRYEELKGRSPSQEEVHARHILVESEEIARDVIAALQKGAAFEDLARQKSNDSGNKYNGGDLGYFTKNIMEPSFAELAFTLKPGEISPNPVRTAYGWHVIKVEDHRMSPVPTYEEARTALRKERIETLTDQIIKSMFKKAGVKTFDINGKQIPKNSNE